MTRFDKARQHVDQLFKNWEQLGGKWAVYPVAFGYLDRRHIKLTEICAIAEKHGISGEVVRMRRGYMLKLAKPYIPAEAQWIDTMHAVVNDAYSQLDEGEITQKKAAAIIREAIALDPTKA